MILEIKQTSSYGQNTFDIIDNGETIYKADSSWMPLVTDRTKKMHITDVSGTLLYQTKYSLVENLGEGLAAFKYLFTGSQKFIKFDIIDAGDNHKGSFYTEMNGIAKSKVCIEYDGKVLVGYRRAIGVKEFVSFYDGETQVGQITKNNKVVDNLDAYILHFLDGYDGWTPILAFFTIYYDYLYYNHSGQINKTYSVKYNYTFDRNNDKYNEDFILKNFGAEEVARMEELMKVTPKIGGMSMKTFWIIFASVWGAALLIAAIILIIIFTNI